MSAIKLSIWFMWKSFINSIKRTWKMTLAISGIILVFVAIGYFAGSSVSDNGYDEEETADEESDDDYEDGIDEKVFPFYISFDDDNGQIYVAYNGVEHNATMLIPELIVAIVFVIVATSAICKGAKKGADIFTMPDVNFLFPSPMKPQSVLLFKTVGQIGATLAGTVYVVFQIPNLMTNFNLSVMAACVILICFIVMMIISKFINVWTYCFLSGHAELKKIVAKYGFAIAFIPVIFVAFFNKCLGWDVYESVYAVAGSNVSRMIPFYGWIKAACVYAFFENYFMFAVFFVLIIAGAVALIWFTWKMDVDFYEDALKQVTLKEEKLESIMNEVNSGVGVNVKHEGKRQARKWDKIRNNMLNFEGFEGGKVLFCKTMLNRKRFYPLCGLWSQTCNIYFWLSILAMFTVKYIFHGEPFIVGIGLILICMFFRSFANPMAEETSHIFMYLMPESPYKIIGWGMAGQFLEGVLDLLPAFIAIFIINDFSFTTILWYFILVTANLFFGMVALMVDTVFTFYLPVMIVNIMQLIVRVIPALPILFVLFVGVIADNMLISLSMIIVINIIMSALCFIPCGMFLFKGKRTIS